MAVIVLAASGAIAVLFAVLMLFQRSLYSAAVCLMAVLLQVGGIYFTLGAQLLGLLQILIYAGAVMVLIVIAVMSAPPHVSKRWAEAHLSPWLVGGTLLAGLAELGVFLFVTRQGTEAWEPVSRSMETDMAALLFGRYALMTETVGLIILVSALAMLQDQEAVPSSKLNVRNPK